MFQLNELREIVFHEKPALKKLVEEYGGMTLLEYAKNNYLRHTIDVSSLASSRKEEFLNFLKSYSSEIF
ncbi:hypothetical protein H6768_01190 [Candidatus Peribacteria bacterium]|nr:hypothetical protein [Candidatus Peribacteria bacterium]